MKISLFLVLVGLILVLASSRSKRAAYDLPSGTELLVGDVRTTFVCSDDGYYADKDKFCQIFHICHSSVNSDGTFKMRQWSFVCGPKTIFDQFSFTCSDPKNAVPCESANDFWYLNGKLRAGPNVPFHNNQDVARAAAAKQRATHSLKPQGFPADFRVTGGSYGGRRPYGRGEQDDERRSHDERGSYVKGETYVEGRTTPKEKRTTPEEKRTTPEEKRTTPRSYIKGETYVERRTTPKEKRTTPEEKRTTPEEKRTTPRSYVKGETYIGRRSYDRRG